MRLSPGHHHHPYIRGQYFPLHDLGLSVAPLSAGIKYPIQSNSSRCTWTQTGQGREGLILQTEKSNLFLPFTSRGQSKVSSSQPQLKHTYHNVWKWTRNRSVLHSKVFVLDESVLKITVCRQQRSEDRDPGEDHEYYAIATLSIYVPGVKDTWP